MTLTSKSKSASTGNKINGNINSDLGNKRYVVTKVPAGCVCVQIADDSNIQRMLGNAGLLESNVGARVVTTSGKDKRKTTMHLLLDTDRLATSVAEIGAAVSAIKDASVCVCIDQVAASYRKALVLAVWKACYSFDANKTTTKSSPATQLVFASASPADAKLHDLLVSVKLAADIENEPANMVTPETLAARIADWFPAANSRVLHAADLRKEGMGLVEAVGQGAASPPCVLLLDSHPTAAVGGRIARKTVASKTAASKTVSKTVASKQRTTVLVGKGVIFDSGGLSVKSLRGMYGMHGDKSGAAVAAAIFRHVLSTSRNKGRRFVAIIPLVENAISSTAVRPGDVATACNGTTVEIVDPDAEGRLILADAIAYAVKHYSPDMVLDFATMTGYGSNIHHDLSAAVYTTNNVLAKAAYDAGEQTGERIWRMPPWPEYVADTASSIADLRNAGWDTYDDGYMGAMFLSNFAPPNGSWVHFDIAKNTASGALVGVFIATGVAMGIDFLTRC
jgi:leucyl aminopeptidase